MQKKLLVLAVAAAISAPAFAADDSKVSVSVYGILDVGYGNASKTVTNSPTAGGALGPNGTAKYDQSAFEFSAMTSSRLGFLATEEMAGGIKATVKVETGISSNPMAGFSQTNGGAAGTNGTTIDATTLGNRELNLSLAFAEGTTVKAGYGSTPIRDISLGYAADPGGNLVGNILNNDATLGSNRYVTLDAIQQMDAIKLTAGLIKDKTSSTLDNPTAGTTTTAANDTKGYQLAAQYAESALSVSGAYQNVKNSAPTTTTTLVNTSDASTKILILGASYDLGAAKLFGEHASIKNDGSTSSTVIATGITTAQPLLAGNGTRTYTSLGVQVPVTAAAMIFAQYSTGTVNRVTTAGNASDSRKISGTTVGAKYNMSKATYAYASLGSTNMKAGTIDPAAVGVKVSQFALGLIHTF